MSLLDLTGRVAVITGSSRGIGRAAAERLAEQGAKIARAAQASMPLRRLGKADDVAGAIVFLGSPAGRYVTGQKMVVDGRTSSATLHSATEVPSLTSKRGRR